MNNFTALNNLSSSELSDAMDSLRIECVLLGIKPLNGGHKVFGPAYTVKYQEYSEPPNESSKVLVIILIV